MARYVKEIPSDGWQTGPYRFLPQANGSLLMKVGDTEYVWGTGDGQIINGVAHFVTPTKPTIRVNGDALVAGDRWYKSNDGTNWFWNGSYWLSTNLYNTFHPQFTIYTNVTTRIQAAITTTPVLPNSALFIETLMISQLQTWDFGSGTTSALLEFGLARNQQQTANLGIILFSRNIFASPLIDGWNTFAINTYVSTAVTGRKIQFEYLQTGTTTLTNGKYTSACLTYRTVEP